MAALDPAREKISHELQEAIVRLRTEIARVEIWATALSAFAQPIPDYTSAREAHRMPPAGAQTEREAQFRAEGRSADQRSSKN
jgi:hypothetical protein